MPDGPHSQIPEDVLQLLQAFMLARGIPPELREVLELTAEPGTAPISLARLVDVVIAPSGQSPNRGEINDIADLTVPIAILTERLSALTASVEQLKELQAQQQGKLLTTAEVEQVVTAKLSDRVTVAQVENIIFKSYGKILLGLVAAAAAAAGIAKLLL